MYDASGDAAAEERAEETARAAAVQGGIANIDSNFAQFDENFYDQRARDYTAFATPQLQSQLVDSRNSLTSDMARRGLLKSSAAVRAGQSLQKYADTQSQAIADQAQSQENSLRSDVAEQRGNLVSQVIASGDPTVASGAALTNALAQARQPAGFGPLGNMFSDWTSMWMAGQRNNLPSSTGTSNPMYSFGQPQSGSSQTIVQ